LEKVPLFELEAYDPAPHRSHILEVSTWQSQEH